MSSHSKRKARDPNAPKRNQSPYLLYQNAMRESFRLQNPGMTFGQVSTTPMKCIAMCFWFLSIGYEIVNCDVPSAVHPCCRLFS